MGKGKIAPNKQFLLLPQRLQTLSVWKSLKFTVWERDNLQLLVTRSLALDSLRRIAFVLTGETGKKLVKNVIIHYSQAL